MTTGHLSEPERLIHTNMWQQLWWTSPRQKTNLPPLVMKAVSRSGHWLLVSYLCPSIVGRDLGRRWIWKSQSGIVTSLGDLLHFNYILSPKGSSVTQDDKPLRFSYQDGTIKHLCKSGEWEDWKLNTRKALLSHFETSGFLLSGPVDTYVQEVRSEFIVLISCLTLRRQVATVCYLDIECGCFNLFFIFTSGTRFCVG